MPEIPTALRRGIEPPPESLRRVPGPSAQPLLVSPQALLPACPAVGCLGCRQQRHYRTATPSALSFPALKGEVCRATDKGRAFNKMINHGSRGKYARRATDKFAWHGVPECVVPAAYTSRACLRHGHIVPAAERNGERIRFACCGSAIDHADEHAAETITGYAFLRPVDDLAEWGRRKANPLGS